MPTLKASPSVKADVLRRAIKKAIDDLSPERLSSLAEFVQFLRTPSMAERLKRAEKDFAEGRGVNWRKVRSDV
jgi:PHD/YefM family antitoxin component YafN of YafNO toxin-antitoxin module